MLTDRFGRGVSDIRVSLSNRCNFHCAYCHDEGLGDVQPVRAASKDEMTADEVVRLLRIAREFDIVRVKFTGGEPMLRSELEEIVAAVSPFMEVSLTTNGSLLASRARGLAEAGLSRVNVSVDSLDPVHFQAIRRGALDAVLKGIDAALAAGLAPVKINTVVFDETVDELPSLLDFVSSRPGLELQLIELMPEIRHDMAVHRVDMAKVKAWLASRAEGVDVREMHHRRKYHVGAATVEVVDPVANHEFCANCHRIRVTHDGRLKGCLNVLDDLIPTRGLDEAGVRQAFRRVVEQRVPFYRSPGSSPTWARGSAPAPAAGTVPVGASRIAPLRPGSADVHTAGAEGSPAARRE
ncbi:MAG: GTP 3',8-cyclase MoaA [Thermoplasmatota archaeon]